MFKGQWFVFEFPKQFKSNIIIFGTDLLIKSYDLRRIKDYKEILLESSRFNNKYKIFSKDELEVFYILTPNIMEEIQGVKNILNKPILFCFVNNRLHIGIKNNSNFFEPTFKKEFSIENETEKIKDQIKVIIDLVDILDLDNNYFKE